MTHFGERPLKICVVGVGYVGEHLVEVFSKYYNVLGYDISESRLKSLEGKFGDNVTLTSKPEDVTDVDVFLISVPTLVRDDKTINNSYLLSACDFVRSKVIPGNLVVIESTISVGTTRDLIGDLRETGVYVGFSPERVDPGRTVPAAHEIPKIISGVDESSLAAIDYVYSKVYDKVVKVSSTETAEMCKLYENCFRLINICYINEIADACKCHDINISEVVSACSTKPFGFMPFLPGLGVGGSCIPVNPYYLFANCNLPFLQQAIDTTNNRPIRKATEFLVDWKGKRILLVGLGFKKGQGLTLYSPSVIFADAIRANSDNVVVYDPLVTWIHSKFHYNILQDSQWTSEYIDASFDVVCILLEQDKVDFNILKELKQCKVVDMTRG